MRRRNGPNARRFAPRAAAPAVSARCASLQGSARRQKPAAVVTAVLAQAHQPLLGDMLVSEVVEADNERLVTRLTNAGLAPKTIHNSIGTFHSVMGLAVRDRHIERNPAAMAELPKVRKSKTPRFLNHDELHRVVPHRCPSRIRSSWPRSRRAERRTAPASSAGRRPSGTGGLFCAC